MTRKLTSQEKTRRRIERRLSALFRAVPMSAYIPDSDLVKAPDTAAAARVVNLRSAE
jgi:hypothetical protein